MTVASRAVPAPQSCLLQQAAPACSPSLLAKQQGQQFGTKWCLRLRGAATGSRQNQRPASSRLCTYSFFGWTCAKGQLARALGQTKWYPSQELRRRVQAAGSHLCWGCGQLGRRQRFRMRLPQSPPKCQTHPWSRSHQFESGLHPVSIRGRDAWFVLRLELGGVPAALRWFRLGRMQ